MRYITLLAMIFSASLVAAQCPGEDSEPALSLKLKNGTTLFICGLEDRDISANGKKGFTDFTVYYELGAADTEATPSTAAPTPARKGNGDSANLDSLKAFVSDANETYWVKAIPNKGFEIEELWFFSEKPTPALQRMITCSGSACTASEPKCVLKMKSNPFPKALADFKKRSAAGSLKEDGEELLDQIFAQAFLGNKEAKEFYAIVPGKLDPSLQDTFVANQKKLAEGCKR